MTKEQLARAIVEIDAKDWLTELEKQTNENAMNLALLKARVEHNHQAVMQNSDVRLHVINDRFDRLEEMVAGNSLGWVQIIKGMGAFLIPAATAVWFTVVAPMQEEIALLREEIQHHARIGSVVDGSKSE